MSGPYYFLSCICDKGGGPFAVNAVMNEHPLDWMADSMEIAKAAGEKPEDYSHIFWAEITEKMYRKNVDKGPWS